MEHRLLGALPAVLCATPQYLQQRGTPAKPEDLREHDLFTPESDRPDLYRLELSRGSQRAEVRVAPQLTVNDPAVLHAAAAAGLGIGLLPEFLCRQGLATGRLKQVLDGLVAAARRLSVCRLSGHARRGSARAALRRFPRGEHRAGARTRLNCALRVFDQR